MPGYIDLGLGAENVTAPVTTGTHRLGLLANGRIGIKPPGGVFTAVPLVGDPLVAKVPAESIVAALDSYQIVAKIINTKLELVAIVDLGAGEVEIQLTLNGAVNAASSARNINWKGGVPGTGYTVDDTVTNVVIGDVVMMDYSAGQGAVAPIVNMPKSNAAAAGRIVTILNTNDKFLNQNGDINLQPASGDKIGVQGAVDALAEFDGDKDQSSLTLIADGANSWWGISTMDGGSLI